MGKMLCGCSNAFFSENGRKLGLGAKAVRCCGETETAVLAGALKDEGFSVVATCPGWVDTDMGSRSDTKEVCFDMNRGKVSL